MIYHTHHDRQRRDLLPGGRTLRDLADTVSDAVKTLAAHREEFDGIVVTGISGLVVGAPVAVQLEKPLLVLRKPGDDSHDGDDRFVNAADVGPGSRLLFMDDFVTAAGTTLARVRCKVSSIGSAVGAIYTYRDDAYETMTARADRGRWEATTDGVRPPF